MLIKWSGLSRKIYLLVAVFLTGCTNQKKPPTTFHGTAFSMEYQVTLGELVNTRQEKEIQRCIAETFCTINQIYNNWNPESEVSVFNRTPSDYPITLSPQLALFLQKVDAIYTLTATRFDPTIYPLQKLWKTKLTQHTLPKTEEVLPLMTSIGWDKMLLKGNQLCKSNPQTELDLCGVSKGYAVDLLLENLKALGHRNLLIEWGGEMRASGEHPYGRAWRVGIKGMDETIDLTECAVATSGDTFQKWTVDHITYSHIINPKTRKPITITKDSITSATIIAPTCMLADALATAVMLFENKDEAEKWIREVQKSYPTLTCWIKTTSGEVLGPICASLP